MPKSAKTARMRFALTAASAWTAPVRIRSVPTVRNAASVLLPVSVVTDARNVRISARNAVRSVRNAPMNSAPPAISAANVPVKTAGARTADSAADARKSVTNAV